MDPNSALRGKVSHVLALSSHLAQPININANIYHWPDYLNIRSKAAQGLLTFLSPWYQTCFNTDHKHILKQFNMHPHV